MRRESSTTATSRRRVGDVGAVLAATRVLVAVSAQSIQSVEDVVTLTQLRALVTIASHDSLNLAGLANALDVHPSSATRVCDRLVAARPARPPGCRRRSPALEPCLDHRKVAGWSTR